MNNKFGVDSFIWAESFSEKIMSHPNDKRIRFRSH